jgi:hypothetical protein
MSLEPRARRRVPAARVALALGTLAALLALALPGTALAHERREVGPYTFVVGFITEPALQGEPNGIDLRITRTDTGEPVEGAQQNLKASIAFGGGQPKEFPLRARFRMPGAYTADVIPTKSGSYIFTFAGDIEGTPITQTFESGPGRFNDVEPADKLQFPDAVPAAAALAAQARSAEERAQAAETRAAAVEHSVAQAQALAIGGLVVGLLGLAAAVVALMSARRAAGSAGQPAVTRSSAARA